MTDKPRVEPSVSEPARQFCGCGKEIEQCADYWPGERTCAGWVHTNGGHYCVDDRANPTDQLAKPKPVIAPQPTGVCEATCLGANCILPNGHDVHVGDNKSSRVKWTNEAPEIAPQPTPEPAIDVFRRANAKFDNPRGYNKLHPEAAPQGVGKLSPEPLKVVVSQGGFSGCTTDALERNSGSSSLWKEHQPSKLEASGSNPDSPTTFQEGYLLGKVEVYCEQVNAGAKLAAELSFDAQFVALVIEAIAQEGCKCVSDYQAASHRGTVWIFTHPFVEILIREFISKTDTPSTIDMFASGKLFGYSDIEVIKFAEKHNGLQQETPLQSPTSATGQGKTAESASSQASQSPTSERSQDSRDALNPKGVEGAGQTARESRSAQQFFDECEVYFDLPQTGKAEDATDFLSGYDTEVRFAAVAFAEAFAEEQVAVETLTLRAELRESQSMREHFRELAKQAYLENAELLCLIQTGSEE